MTISEYSNIILKSSNDITQRFENVLDRLDCRVSPRNHPGNRPSASARGQDPRGTSRVQACPTMGILLNLWSYFGLIYLKSNLIYQPLLSMDYQGRQDSKLALKRRFISRRKELRLCGHSGCGSVNENTFAILNPQMVLNFD